MDTQTSRKVLGITPDASAEEIRLAWRRLASRWHPDRFAQNPAMQTFTGARLKEFNRA